MDEEQIKQKLTSSPTNIALFIRALDINVERAPLNIVNWDFASRVDRDGTRTIWIRDTLSTEETRMCLAVELFNVIKSEKATEHKAVLSLFWSDKIEKQSQYFKSRESAIRMMLPLLEIKEEEQLVIANRYIVPIWAVHLRRKQLLTSQIPT